MKFRAICLVIIGILLISTFGCVIGSGNVTDINKTNKKNVSLNSSIVNNSNTTNASTIYVDQARGNDANPGTSDNPKRSIKSAVYAVYENGTISVASGQYSGDNNTNIVINKNINIIGQDTFSTIINGCKNQIYSIIADKTVFIKGFTILNGQSEQGGSIKNLGYLNINSCVFKDNEASTGGAVYNKNNLEISNCNFTDNNANQGNGLGGAVYSRQGLCNITSSYFANNSASGDGGAINNNYDSDLILVSSNFENNNARTAGAISNAQNCNINSCEFIQNTADKMAGALYSMGNLNIDNSKFDQNIARFDDGGAIGIYSSYSTTITNTNFSGNHAKNYGAISSNGELNLSNINFINNQADENGGAVGSFENLNIENSNFTNNTSDSYGGAIYGYGGLNNIINNNLVNNTGKVGGAVVVSSASIINNNNFTSNSAKQGGAVYNSFKGDASYPSAKMDSNNFTKNSATDIGGALINTGQGILTHNNFTMNKITADTGLGGAILNYDGILYINEGNEFFHNVIFTEKGLGDPVGGGITNCNNSHMYINGSGNIFTDSNIYNNAYLTIGKCTIEKNTDDDNYLNNQNAERFIISSECIIQKSNHTCSKPGTRGHIDVPTNVTIKRGDESILKTHLWCEYDDQHVSLMQGCVNFKVYNKERNFYIATWLTNGKGDINFMLPGALPPGDYCLQISYDGNSGFMKEDPCIKTIEYTIT